MYLRVKANYVLINFIVRDQSPDFCGIGLLQRVEERS
jgi:hypothetical protein